jgi:hypothetical protein
LTLQRRRRGVAWRRQQTEAVGHITGRASTRSRTPLLDWSMSRHARTENPSSKRIHAVAPILPRGAFLKSLRIAIILEAAWA